MKPRNTKWLHRISAVFVTVCALALPLFFQDKMSKYPYGFILLITSIWAAVDVRRMKFSNYRVTYPYGPIGSFFFHILLWFFAFPWFFSTWLDIRSGIVKERREAPDELSPMVKSIFKISLSK